MKNELELTNRETHFLFPSIVFSSLIKDQSFLDNLQDSVLKLMKDPNSGVSNGSVGWLSNDFLHNHKDFKDLHDLLIEELKSVFDYYQIWYDSVYLTSMWANVAHRSEYCHQNHIHPNSLFSGVLHVSVANTDQGTSFSDPRPGATIFQPEVKEMGIINSGVFVPNHQRGQLFIFPSYLPHGVRISTNPYKQGNKRITISFNAMMTGKITTHSAPLTLK